MQKYRMGKGRRAEMGVGTMIIFIAMVLVAAVAASVLISTANQVREQAQTTGEQAIANVASGLTVQDVVGENNGTVLKNVTIYIRVAAGSPNINMDNALVSVTTGIATNVLSLAEEADGNVSYNMSKLHNVQLLQPNVIGQGDLAQLNITGLDVGYNQMVSIKIIPAYGQMTLITFVTPEQFSATYTTLY